MEGGTQQAFSCLVCALSEAKGMIKNMNKIILIGRLTRDPEIRYSTNDNNTAIARYTLAVNRPFRKNGEQQADFLPCIAFGKTAEFAEKYLAKGMRVAIEGCIQTGSYTNQEGQKIYTTDVVVERQEFLEKRADNGQQSPDNANNYDDRYMDIPNGIDEELPFN